MPGLDGKGPEGKGSMTGRGLGRCKDVGTNSPMFGRGRGFGQGRGLGRGFGRGFGRFGFNRTGNDSENKNKEE